MAAGLGVGSARAEEHCTDEDQADAADGEKGIVPRRDTESFDDMVKIEDMMVDQALDEVEEAPTEEE